jgi:adenine-specific DNA-methyltransferase
MPKMEKSFRITNRRYLGSKTKLLSFIHATIKKENIYFNSFLDLFAGTGSVADSFNDGRHKIVLNDILESNRCVYNAFFGKDFIDEKKLTQFIKHFNESLIVESNYFSEMFSNTFFSEENCMKIGYIRDQIDTLFSNKTINAREKDYLISTLLFSMDRIANTVGHYDAFRRSGDLSKHLLLFSLEVYSPEINMQNEIFKMDSNELVKSLNCDLVYIDPPYNSRQYSDAYHVLENVASWKKPKVYGVARKMDRTDLKSRYSENSAPRVFAKLIEDLKCKYIIVSYNNMGEKGADRSQAKISDIDIIRSLEQKGKVTIHETDFNQFSAGKTKVEGHKERLFVCKVGDFEKPQSINISEFVKSPLNYTGGKYKLLSELMNRFPSGDGTFIDLFGGGFNVGVNVSNKFVVYNDFSEPTTRLIKLFYNFSTSEITNKLDNLIEKYCLSDSFKYGYEFYNSNSSNGLGSYNKKSFIQLKNDYNLLSNSIDKDYLLLLLTIYSFNNQIRFNSKGFYNLPVGKRDFNSSIRRNIKLFSEKMKTKKVVFLSNDFKDFKHDKYVNPFFYCDPPYLLGDASYNENGGWNKYKEIELLSFLNNLSVNGVKFGLSNVLEHKGRTNQILLDWTIKNKYNIFYLDKKYSNSNYQIKDKEQKTVEVFITNY